MKQRLNQIWVVRFVLQMAHIYFEKRLSRCAAQLAYFLILSLFPVLICANAIVGMLHFNVSEIVEGTGTLIPEGVREIMADYLGYIGGNQPGLLAAGVLMTLYSASAAFRSLMDSMDDIYEQRRRMGIKQIGVSVLYSALLLVTIYVSAVVVLTGEWFLRALETYLPFSLTESNWSWLRFLILFFLMLALVLIVYRLSAPKGNVHPPVFTGALLATAALVGASGLFSRFIGMSARYSLVYGSLASVIILMVWLYLCGNILILGNVFNCVWYRYKKEREK